jgi:hypothetical protein
VSWVEGGVPRGEDKELPPGPLLASDWPLGTPDLVLTSKEGVPVAAEADQERDLVFPTGLPSAARLAAVDLRPGDPSVVRGATLHVAGAVERLLGSWVPGQAPVPLPDGVSWRLPAGSALRVRVHYRGSGRPAVDRSTIGLYLRRSAGSERAVQQQTLGASEEKPAEAGLRRLTGSTRLTRAAEVVALTPRSDTDLVSLELSAYRPDGTANVLLWTRQGAGWSPTYFPKGLLALPAHTRLEATAYVKAGPGAPGAGSRDPLCTILYAPTTDGARRDQRAAAFSARRARGPAR